MSKLATRHDAVRIPLGPKDLYYFTRPEHAQHVLTANAEQYVKGIGQVHARRALGSGLLTSEGPEWARARATLRPLFAKDRIPMQAAVIEREAVQLARRLTQDQTQRGLRETLADFTLRVLGPTLIGQDLGRYPKLGAAFDEVQEQAIFEMLTLNSLSSRSVPGRTRRYEQALAYLEDVVADLVHRSDQDQNGCPALVGLILAEPSDDPEAHHGRIRDELVTMLLAGHETTASTLAWAVCLVARDRAVYRRIRLEAQDALGDGPTGQPERLLARLPFTTAVVHEVMRLHPPVWLISRRVVHGDTIGGYDVPAGSDVLICPYALHRDPRYWESSNDFVPERFLGSFPTTSRYAYIPFGAGPRSCIGRSLGLTETVLALARLCRDTNFAVSHQPKRHRAMLTLRPDHRIALRHLKSY